MLGAKSARTDLEFKVSSDHKDLESADVIIFTAGVSATKIGSSNREAALPFVYKIITDYAEHIKRYAPKSLVLMITNPVDITTWIMQEKTGFPPEKVLGFGCELDSRRFMRVLRNELDQVGIIIKTIGADVIGGHSADGMIFPRASIKLDGKGVSDFGERDREIIELAIQKAESETRDYGFTIIKDGGRSSIEPVIFLAYAARSYLFGSESYMSCSQVLQTGRSYNNIDNSCVSVPVRINKGTVEISSQYLLSAEELGLLGRVAKNHQTLFNHITSMSDELAEKFQKALEELEEQKKLYEVKKELYEEQVKSSNKKNIGKSQSPSTLQRLPSDDTKVFIENVMELEEGVEHSVIKIKVKDSIDISDEKKISVLNATMSYFKKSSSAIKDEECSISEDKKSLLLPNRKEVRAILESLNLLKESSLQSKL
ncbi:MAG: hypothetical protein V4612_06520 [Pseudomonadota bacterium]